MFFIANAFKEQVHMFVGQVKIVIFYPLILLSSYYPQYLYCYAVFTGVSGWPYRSTSSHTSLSALPRNDDTVVQLLSPAIHSTYSRERLDTAVSLLLLRKHNFYARYTLVLGFKPKITLLPKSLIQLIIHFCINTY